MLKLNKLTEDPARVIKLLGFAEEILSICDKLGIEPILSGSLAVLAYTKDENIRVNDIDLACHEGQFVSIIAAIQEKNLVYKLKGWHVLQVLKEDLKVEFDAIEYWMGDLPAAYDVLDTGNFKIKVVSLDYLVKLYQRGLADTALKNDEINKQKHAELGLKVDALLRAVRRVD